MTKLCHNEFYRNAYDSNGTQVLRRSEKIFFDSVKRKSSSICQYICIKGSSNAEGSYLSSLNKFINSSFISYSLGFRQRQEYSFKRECLELQALKLFPCRFTLTGHFTFATFEVTRILTYQH